MLGLSCGSTQQDCRDTASASPGSVQSDAAEGSDGELISPDTASASPETPEAAASAVSASEADRSDSDVDEVVASDASPVAAFSYRLGGCFSYQLGRGEPGSGCICRGCLGGNQVRLWCCCGVRCKLLLISRLQKDLGVIFSTGKAIDG